MTIYIGLIIVCWIVFLLYWVYASFGIERTPGQRHAARGIWLRVLAVVILLGILHIEPLRSITYYRFTNPVIDGLGVILCVLGVAFAISARRHLGMNWGLPMEVKENPTLITSGPYSLVRHPIYTGVIFATFGSMLAGGLIWSVPFIVFLFYFMRSANVEEKMLLKQFPDAYPAYQAHTKWLIPYVW